MHQAAVIAGRTSLRLRIQNRLSSSPPASRSKPRRSSPQTSRQTRSTAPNPQSRPDRSPAPPSATASAHRPTQVPQPMATRVIRHPMRIVSPHILQPQPLRQKLRELKHLRQQSLHLRHQRLVLNSLRHLRIMVPHHRHTSKTGTTTASAP